VKKSLVFLLAVLLVATAFSGCSRVKVYPMGKAAEVKEFRFSDEENKCDYCEKSPVCVFHNPNDPEGKNNAYICEDCASKCAFCGKTPKYYYQNGTSAVIFVCEECYNDAVKNELL